ncbi:MAG: DUF3239 domain-containing protein [Phycisphaerae bacterium]|nr:DUF3239 domain-containing protein [Phycisphaerae bacterium]
MRLNNKEKMTGVASNPGFIKVDILHWVKFYPVQTIGRFGSILASAFFANLFPICYIYLIVMFYLERSYWRWVKGHFIYGCINPAVIVTLNPLLAAVSTDLTNRDGYYPVIKIIKVKPFTIDGQPLGIGTKIPTVALYSRKHATEYRWGGFNPIPVAYATSDASEIQRCLDSIEDSDWQELFEHLKEIPEPYKAGLYKLFDEFEQI